MGVPFKSKSQKAIYYQLSLLSAQLEIIEANEPAPVIPDINISSFKKKTAVDIHKFVMKTKKKGKGVETIISSPQMMKYMNIFKRLMDTCSSAEMDYLTAKYKGFYYVARLLENFAGAI